MSDEEPLDPLDPLGLLGEVPEQRPDGVTLMVGIVPPEELARLQLEWERMSRFILRAHESVARMPPQLRRSYQAKLRNLVGDIEALLGLGELDDDRRANLLGIFLQFDDDDDGDLEPETEDAPPGEVVDA